MVTQKTVVKMILKIGLTHFNFKEMNWEFKVLPIRIFISDPKEF